MPNHILIVDDIVDDHESLRRGLRLVLSSRPDWQICGEAVDGIDAIEKARSLKPSVVLMDISMPRMDGLQATRTLRRELPDSKVIVISQNAPEIARKQALDAGASAFVSKSSLAAELIPAIEHIVGKNPAATSTAAAPDATHPCPG